jgi:hypothetical protein
MIFYFRQDPVKNDFIIPFYEPIAVSQIIIIA